MQLGALNEKIEYFLDERCDGHNGENGITANEDHAD